MEDFDQLLRLSQLRPQVAAVVKSLGAHHRERDVMTRHSGFGFRRKKIASGRLEELKDCFVLERRRVRHIDDNLRPRERPTVPRRSAC